MLQSISSEYNILWHAIKVILLEEEGFSNLIENIKFIHYFRLFMTFRMDPCCFLGTILLSNNVNSINQSLVNISPFHTGQTAHLHPLTSHCCVQCECVFLYMTPRRAFVLLCATSCVEDEAVSLLVAKIFPSLSVSSVQAEFERWTEVNDVGEAPVVWCCLMTCRMCWFLLQYFAFTVNSCQCEWLQLPVVSGLTCVSKIKPVYTSRFWFNSGIQFWFFLSFKTLV